MFGSLRNFAKRHCGHMLAVLLLAGMEMCTAWASGELEAIKLAPDRLPQGWKLVTDYPVPESKVVRFEAKFVASIDAMLNQTLLAGSREVKVNYLACRTPYDAKNAYRNLVEFVGSQNVIVRKDNVVVEIIGVDKALKAELLPLLGVSPLQERKISAPDLPPGWRLVKAFFSTDEEIKQFEQKFGAPIDDVINQFFLIDEKRAQINTIACPSQEDAETTYQALEKLVGQVNLVVKADRFVMEIITPFEELKPLIRQAMEKQMREN